jgi:SEC-C motif domain protein
MFNDTSTASAQAPSASASTVTGPCPCGTGKSYARCCEPLHEGSPAADALSLMRARYSAYVLKRAAFLLDTWHPSTRPPSLDLSDRPGLRTHWLGLQVISNRSIDPQRAEVSFIARVRVGGGPAQRMAERSRFLREENLWYYVDGEIGPKS